MVYRFRDYALDVGRRELRHGSVICHVEPQVFDLLTYLIQNHDRAVSKEEVFNAIWPAKVVCEATLSSRLNAARNAIGDNGRDQHLIRTLRTKGFRFVGEVRQENPASTPPLIIAGDPDVECALMDRPTLAVLPFENMDGDPKEERFIRALMDDLITEFASCDWLPTVSRDSSLGCKDKPIEVQQTSRRLRARYLLRGSVRRVGDHQRISVQLVDGFADRNIWANRYDVTVADLATFMDDVVKRVATSIRPLLFHAEQLRAGRKSCEALNTWESMVRALSLMNTRERTLVEDARLVMQEASLADPCSAQVHSLLSFITTLGVHQGWQRRAQEIPHALHIARTALSLNSDEAWAHLAFGYANIWVHPELAVPHLEKALGLNPNLAIAHYLLALACAYAGQGDLALSHGEIAERLGPRDLLSHGNSGAHYNVRATACFGLGRYHAGIEFARKAIIESPGMPTAHRAFLINNALAGRREEAKAGLQRIQRVAPSMSQIWIRESAVWSRGEDHRKYVEAFRIAGLIK